MSFYIVQTAYDIKTVTKLTPARVITASVATIKAKKG